MSARPRVKISVRFSGCVINLCSWCAQDRSLFDSRLVIRYTSVWLASNRERPKRSPRDGSSFITAEPSDLRSWPPEGRRVSPLFPWDRVAQNARLVGIELPPVLSFPLTDPARLPQAALQHDVAAHQQLRLHIRLTVPLPSDVGKTVATATTMSCWSTASCDGRFRNTLARHVFFKIELPTERSNFGQVTCGRARAHVKCVRTCSATNLGLNERINHSEPS